MPATAGRVRMPADNRLSVSDSLRISEIWQKSVGYDPYAPESSNAGTPASTVSSNVEEKAKGLFALARLTGSSSAVTPGACPKCNQVGHLAFQCRNLIKLPKPTLPATKPVDIPSTTVIPAPAPPSLDRSREHSLDTGKGGRFKRDDRDSSERRRRHHRKRHRHRKKESRKSDDDSSTSEDSSRSRKRYRSKKGYRRHHQRRHHRSSSVESMRKRNVSSSSNSSRSSKSKSRKKHRSSKRRRHSSSD